MKARMYQVHLGGKKLGWLPKLLLSALALAGIALLIMVGVTVLVIGLGASLLAALWLGLRRALLPTSSGQSPIESPVRWSEPDRASSEVAVRDVEVEVLKIESQDR
jgi:hypothetical protein